jgi:hypothetical protein
MSMPPKESSGHVVEEGCQGGDRGQQDHVDHGDQHGEADDTVGAEVVLDGERRRGWSPTMSRTRS